MHSVSEVLALIDTSVAARRPVATPPADMLRRVLARPDPLALQHTMSILHLFISPGHIYVGHHGGPPGKHPILAVARIECVAGRGIRGDRFFDYKPDYKGQITFFARENLVRMWQELGVPAGQRDPSATRRNIITEGLDLDALIGMEFEIQGIRFLGTEECRPCYWMNGAIHPAAEEWMKGKGGLRAKILSGGWLEPSVNPGENEIHSTPSSVPRYFL
jgi:hypothetical protein